MRACVCRTTSGRARARLARGEGWPGVEDDKLFASAEDWLLPHLHGLKTEADLRGVLSNDSMTEDEKRLLEEERTKVEETAKLRDEDYQLAYAVDIIKGLAIGAMPTP